mgnify:CR=1 FL=1
MKIVYVHGIAQEQKNEALPVTVFLGGPPALILSAIAPLPENLPELMLASYSWARRLHIMRRTRLRPFKVFSAVSMSLRLERRRRPEFVAFETGTRRVMRSLSISVIFR